MPKLKKLASPPIGSVLDLQPGAADYHADARLSPYPCLNYDDHNTAPGDRIIVDLNQLALMMGR